MVDCSKKKRKRHICGYAECKNCGQECNLSQHQCYMQLLSADQDELPKKKRRFRRGAAAGLQTLRANTGE